jgi:hypothetical protein
MTHGWLTFIAWLSIGLVLVRLLDGGTPECFDDCADKFHENRSPDQDCEYLPIAPIIQTLLRFADGHDVHDFNEAVNNPIRSENDCDNISEG